MSVMQVLRLNGRVINIGPWDGLPAERWTVDRLTGAEEVQEDGSLAFVWRNADGEIVSVGDPGYGTQLVETNPIPEGAVWSEEEVVVGPDGGLYAPDDPRLG